MSVYEIYLVTPGARESGWSEQVRANSLESAVRAGQARAAELSSGTRIGEQVDLRAIYEDSEDGGRLLWHSEFDPR